LEKGIEMALLKRHLAILLALLATLVVLTLSACGGQEANKKSESGGSGPTSGQIAFRRWFDPDQTEGALFTMNPDGSHIRQITHPPEGWRDDDPVWSPNGESIVFNREKIDESTSWIADVNPDTGDTRDVTRCTGRCIYDFNPTFSPDGRSIAFNRGVGPPILKGVPRPIDWSKISTPEWKNYGAIFIVGLDGSEPHQVTETPKRREGQLATEVGEPAISPDGKMLAFVRTRYEPEENTAVFVQPIDSPEDAHQVTPWKSNCQERPEFSPDGELMLFRCLPEGEEGPSNLYWVHPDGTGLHKLTHEEDADKQYLGSSFSPSFSSGEGWITVGRTAGYGAEGNADVFRVLVQDGEVVREVNLTKSEKWESNPNWGSHQPVG
jgi:Tol biopolymer transport system component